MALAGVQEALQIDLVDLGLARRDLVKLAGFHPGFELIHQAEEVIEGVHDKQQRLIVIDVEGLVPVDDYTLEVSSPGLDRKLATRADYERFQASPVKVQTFTPVAGNRHWLGKLSEVKPEGIVLDLTAKKQKGSKKGPAPVQTVEIAFSNIEKANLAPEI